ncbi:unnamed protein product [Paramecium pentaurelia]|uniref:Uncharacterized protein n=1 Tax=Paramecium pentaurelia TaxID=43138 RepID=A0A8S1SXN7_9CILI|nr:unnamed protein product [Paramecium pentaurelia]
MVILVFLETFVKITKMIVFNLKRDPVYGFRIHVLINYSNCEDAKFKTFQDNNICKLYHNDCVSDGQKSIQVVQNILFIQYHMHVLIHPKKKLVFGIKQQKILNQQYVKIINTTTLTMKKLHVTKELMVYVFLVFHLKERQDSYQILESQGMSRSLQCIKQSKLLKHLIRQIMLLTKLLPPCQGGGIDDTKPTICAFIPKEINSQNGTCKTFSQCADADKDEFTCKSNPSCYWNINKCVDQTYETFSSGLNCNPKPSFEGTKNTICLFENGKCQTYDPKIISESKACFIKSAYIYIWNSIINQCEACFHSTTPQNPGSTNIDIILSVFVTAILMV